MTLDPTSSRGGAAGYAIGTDALLLNITAQAGLAAGNSTHVNCTVSHTDGTALSRNADLYTIDVAADGWYVATLCVPLSSAQAMATWELSLDTTANPEGDTIIPGGAAGSSVDLSYTTPILHISAGGFLRFTCRGNAGAGTYAISSFSTAYHVVRLG